MRQIKKIRWAGIVVRLGDRRRADGVSVEKHDGKRPLGRPRRRWIDNIKIHLQEVGQGSMDCIALAQ